MTSRSADEPGPPPATVDLDGLIGDIRQESARMRAAPEFPLDREAALGAELDRLAPGPARPRLDRLIDVVDALGRSRPAGPAPGGILNRLKPPPDPRGAGGELAGAVAGALRILSGRLADIDERLASLERTARPVPAGPGPALPGEGRGGPDLSWWLDVVREVVAPGAGRVLYAGVAAGPRLAALVEAGFDAYALAPDGPDDPDGPSDVDGPDDEVRAGDLVDHLRGVGDGALAAALMEAPTAGTTTSALPGLAVELGRAAEAVVVVSEAPWWWARRLGTEAADLAADRPLHADTWMALLDRAGFTVSALYDGAGSTYLVTATRPG